MTPKEENTFRIVHLSDLHCDDSNEWKSIFKKIKTVIINSEANLVIITGDLVDKPKEDYFNSLKGKLITLLNDINLLLSDESDPIYLLTVPGNHDYNRFMGWHIFTPNVQRYNKFISDLHAELGASHKKIGRTEKDTITNIYKYYGISIFSFDSNETDNLHLARGRILNPREEISKQCEIFKEVPKPIKEFEKTFKIGMLHHHPVSPGKYIRDKWWQLFQNIGLDMENSYPFLKETNKANLNLILHGHKHLSGTISIIFPNSDESSEEIPFAISACGSSSSCGESELDIKIYDIRGLMSCVSNTLIYNRKARNEFELNSSLKKILIRDNSRRNQINELSIDTPNNRVKRARLKSKQVQIYSSGAADVEIMHYGVHTDTTSIQNASFDECISNDYGRLVWGKSTSSSRDSVLDNFQDWDDWDNPLYTCMNIPSNTASEEEFFHKSFSVPRTTLNYENNLFGIRYYLQNGYIFTEDEHEILYLDDNILHSDFKEFCSISSEFPVDEMELIVRFPDEYDIFPDGSSFKICVQDSNSREVIDSEVEFLVKHEALRVRGIYNSAVLQIKNPQPNLIYSITWKTIYNNLYSPSKLEEKAHKVLQDAFLTGDNPVELFINDLQFILQDYFNDHTIRIFPVGYNSSTKKMSISVNPDKDKFTEFYPIAPGRGLVGSAFLRGEFTYWDNEEFEHEFGNHSYTIEKMVDKINPTAVIGIPLRMSSYFDPLDRDDIDEEEEDSTEIERAFFSMYKNYDAPFASLSIVTEKEGSKLKIDYTDKQNNYRFTPEYKIDIEHKVSQVWFFVEELMPDYLENLIMFDT